MKLNIKHFSTNFEQNHSVGMSFWVYIVREKIAPEHPIYAIQIMQSEYQENEMSAKEKLMIVIEDDI